MDTEKQDNPKTTRVIGVRFRPVGKVYHFDASEYPDLRVGDFVVVDTVRGQQLGRVACLTTLADESVPGSLKPVGRRATGRDLAIQQYWENRQARALETVREFVRQENLAIKVIGVEYSFDGKRLICLYSAEGQSQASVKSLQRYLRKTFRASIELRQIGPRDAAKVMEGLGACGKVRCCSEFIVNFTPISIRMAKTQGVSLSPTEITGMCGRLRCCLSYEQEQYKAAIEELPKKGKWVATPYGEGKVVNLSPLQEIAVIAIGDRQVQVCQDEIYSVEEWQAMEARGELPQLPGALETVTPAPELPDEDKSVEKKEQEVTPERLRGRGRKKGRSSARPISKDQATTDPPAASAGDEKKRPPRRRSKRRPRKR